MVYYEGTCKTKIVNESFKKTQICWDEPSIEKEHVSFIFLFMLVLVLAFTIAAIHHEIQ